MAKYLFVYHGGKAAVDPTERKAVMDAWGAWFGSLGAANNPTLAGLGYACALGLFWSLAATIFFTLPAAAAAEPKSWREESLQPFVKEPENA